MGCKWGLCDLARSRGRRPRASRRAEQGASWLNVFLSHFAPCVSLNARMKFTLELKICLTSPLQSNNWFYPLDISIYSLLILQTIMFTLYSKVILYLQINVKHSASLASMQKTNRKIV